MLSKTFLRSFSGQAQKYDIIINGGGIAGLSLLLRLQGSPFMSDKRILLLEQSPELAYYEPNPHERVFSNRVSSLTQDTCNFFRKLGVWSEVEVFAKPINTMHVWSHDVARGVTFFPASIGSVRDSKLPLHVCHILENKYITNSLLKQLDVGNIRFRSTVKSLSGKDEITILLDSGEVLTTRLLVGCDGFNSIVRKSSDLKYFECDLEQKAIVGTVELGFSGVHQKNDVAYQRFVPHNGCVLALLPLADTTASFVYSCPESEAHRFMAMEHNSLVNELNDALTRESPSNLLNYVMHAEIIPQILPVGPTPPEIPEVISLDPESRAVFPLHFGTTLPWMVGRLKYSSRKVVIIGDAAHRIHPLAGQGLNLGIGDVVALCDTLEDFLVRGEDPLVNEIAMEDWFVDFQNRRTAKLVTMMGAIHSINALFKYIPSGFINLFNRLEWIKSEIVKFSNTN